MNSINVDGKNYVKAKDLARELGYTGDYVGQLCRAEKVDAQLVGRSWYVNEASLRAHKDGRYRSNKQETLKAVERELRTKDADSQETFAVPIRERGQASQARSEDYAHQSFYQRAPASVATTYHTDEAELIPGERASVRTGSIGVTLADSRRVKIASKGKTFDFDPTQRPKLKFKGSLDVADVEDEADSEEPETEQKQTSGAAKASVTPVTVHKKEVSSDAEKTSKPSEIASKIKVKHRRPSTKDKARKLPLEQNAQGIIGMKRGRIVGRNPVGGTLRVEVPKKIEKQKRGGAFVLVLSTLTAIILGVLISSIEQTTTVVSGEVVVQYTLDLENILAASYDALR